MYAILIMSILIGGCGTVLRNNQVDEIEINNQETNNDISILSVSTIKWEDQSTASMSQIEKSLIERVISKTSSMIAMNGFGPNLVIKFDKINLIEFRNSVIACDAMIAITQDENDVVLNIKARGRQDIVNHNNGLAMEHISTKLARIIRDTLVKHFQAGQMSTPSINIKKKPSLEIELQK